MPAKSTKQFKLNQSRVSLALSSLAAIAQAERRQRLLESKAQHCERMQSILDRLELERQKLRLVNELSPRLS